MGALTPSLSNPVPVSGSAYSEALHLEAYGSSLATALDGSPPNPSEWTIEGIRRTITFPGSADSGYYTRLFVAGSVTSASVETYYFDPTGIDPGPEGATLWAGMSGPRFDNGFTGSYRHFLVYMPQGTWTLQSFYGGSESGAVPDENLLAPTGFPLVAPYADYAEYETGSGAGNQTLYVQIEDFSQPFAVMSLTGWHAENVTPPTSTTETRFDPTCGLTWADPAVVTPPDPPAGAFGWGVLL